jgi:hypothetical protein
MLHVNPLIAADSDHPNGADMVNAQAPDWYAEACRLRRILAVLIAECHEIEDTVPMPHHARFMRAVERAENGVKADA